MNGNEIKNWFKLLYEELPSIVRPLFSLGIFLIVFLVVGNNLKLNDSLWSFTNDGLFNLALYLGIFSLIFRALNKAPLEWRKTYFSIKYSVNKLNKDYFLGQYSGSDKVFVFELNKKENKKYWIENLTTKRQLWPGVDATPLIIGSESTTIGETTIDMNSYKANQEFDGKIDILNSSQKDNLFLIIMSVVIVTVIQKFF